ncbi:hypothetical protein AMATHDRAFT_70444 [Amanita thiersii Skay4041]|uniref:Uncharacterized protein n=1 Tax=Amanita thiersii Skay4041 TaxID=703135 RepID=A0A2A9NA11_9AGAR|nr:hypothetical protein AMATHDRAFT_70444 [Amanita thiersii Skay4041]
MQRDLAYISVHSLQHNSILKMHPNSVENDTAQRLWSIPWPAPRQDHDPKLASAHKLAEFQLKLLEIRA